MISKDPVVVVFDQSLPGGGVGGGGMGGAIHSPNLNFDPLELGYETLYFNFNRILFGAYVLATNDDISIFYCNIVQNACKIGLEQVIRLNNG